MVPLDVDKLPDLDKLHTAVSEFENVENLRGLSADALAENANVVDADPPLKPSLAVIVILPPAADVAVTVNCPVFGSYTPVIALGFDAVTEYVSVCPSGSVATADTTSGVPAVRLIVPPGLDGFHTGGLLPGAMF